MARQFSFAEAKRIREENEGLLERLYGAAQIEKELKKDITDACTALREAAVMQILREVPVEEIGRGRRIRYRVLREYGYETAADLARASLEDLEKIVGISDESARDVFRLKEEILSYTRSVTRVRISSDSRTPLYTKLIRALSIYRRTSEHLWQCSRLLSAEGKSITSALEQSRPAASALRWLFTSAQKKEAAEQACVRLKNRLGSSFEERVIHESDLVIQETKTGDDEAWQDFAANSVQFFTILEDLSPGTLGTENPVYGLPEELAASIREQPVSTGGLKCTLRKYQLWGVKYILHQKRVLLGDEMGLGKTVQAIAAMVSLRNAGETHFAVVCPAGVLSNWQRELQTKSDLTVCRVHGQNKDRKFEAWVREGGVLLTTYDTASALNPGDDVRICMLTADEAHYIKNKDALRTKAVRRLAAHAGRILLMSGTALENRVDEMIALIRILQPETASRLENIKYLAAAEAFRKQAAAVYYRRKREDVLAELPELIENREWCTLGREEEYAYEKAVLSGTYNEARRVSWNVGDADLSAKAARLREIVQEAEEEDRKILVFSFFLDTLAMVTKISGIHCLKPLTGALSSAERQALIDAFEVSAAGTVLPAQITSGGTGLNIQSASVVIICEPQLKPSSENQAIARAYRMGQTRNVIVCRLLAEDTIDERITEMLEEKQMIFDAFADTSEAALKTVELDETTLGAIIREEAERIQNRENDKEEL